MRVVLTTSPSGLFGRLKQKHTTEFGAQEHDDGGNPQRECQSLLGVEDKRTTPVIAGTLLT